MDWTQIILAISAGVVAILTGGFVWSKTISRKRDSRINVVSQKNNDAGGDIVGGDKITKP